jgi:hypothetical protein
MKVTPREAALALATGAVMLFGATVFMVRPKVDELRDLWKRQAEAARETELDMKLVNQRGQWEKSMAELSTRLPVQPADKQMDAYWLSVMDDMAARHGVKITKRQAMAEKRNGPLYELPIECKEWEADLASITHFLFDLQEEGDMLDIQQLYIRPKEGGQLRGRFTLNCAYTRVPAAERGRASEKAPSERGQPGKGQS